jgi:hypothetical protein
MPQAAAVTGMPTAGQSRRLPAAFVKVATLKGKIHMRELTMKILLWVILIIFLIGLLVVTGVFKMIF